MSAMQSQLIRSDGDGSRRFEAKLNTLEANRTRRERRDTR